MQKGNVFQSHGSWYVRYCEPEGKRIARRLGYVSDFPSREAIEPLMQELMPLINQWSAHSLGRFVEDSYLPFVRDHLRPSTYRGYRTLWNSLSPQCGQMTLRHTKTFDVQRFLDRLASEGKYCKSTIQHAKHLLSGVFRYALQQGLYEGVNPVTAASIPRTARPPAETHAYSLDEITRMAKVLPEPAATIVLTAAFTGLRVGEIQGMVWENLRPGQPFAHYNVTSAIWRGQSMEPKTDKSKAAVPIIPQLAELLAAHCARCGKPEAGPIFADSDHKPLDLNRLYQLKMKTLLAKEGIKWHGWHAFRRGLASNLFELGCDDMTVQRILRHSRVVVTREKYIKLRDAKMEDAMNRLSIAASNVFPRKR